MTENPYAARGCRVLVAIGANLPGPDGTPPLATCRAAVARLAALPGLTLLARSPWFASEAEPLGGGAPEYVNGAVMLGGPPGDAALLLARLHAVEAAFGRARSLPNAPRVLDLDLLDAWGLLGEAPGPVLPHPRAHLRRFVLLPVARIAPEWRHPRLGQTAATLLAGLPPGPIPRQIAD